MKGKVMKRSNNKGSNEKKSNENQFINYCYNL